MNTQPLANQFRTRPAVPVAKPNTFRKPKTLQGSAYLFREAYRTLLDALFTFFRIELPRWWHEFRVNNIVDDDPYEPTAEPTRWDERVMNALSVFMLALLVLFIWGCVWIWWILTH